MTVLEGRLDGHLSEANNAKKILDRMDKNNNRYDAVRNRFNAELESVSKVKDEIKDLKEKSVDILSQLKEDYINAKGGKEYFEAQAKKTDSKFSQAQIQKGLEQWGGKTEQLEEVIAKLEAELKNRTPQARATASGSHEVPKEAEPAPAPRAQTPPRASSARSEETTRNPYAAASLDEIKKEMRDAEKLTKSQIQKMSFNERQHLIQNMEDLKVQLVQAMQTRGLGGLGGPEHMLLQEISKKDVIGRLKNPESIKESLFTKFINMFKS